MNPSSLFSVLISGPLQPAKLGVIRGKRAGTHIQVTRTNTPGTISGTLVVCMCFCYGNDLQ